MSPIARPGRADLDQAVARLRAGGLVAIPTETVYGLGALAVDPAALARVFEVKDRPRFNPLILHAHDADAAFRWVADGAVPGIAHQLARAFWPGPLTLVLLKQPAVPDLATAGRPSVALRVPDHPLTRTLLQRLDAPLAAPSANRSGRLSPTTADDVARELGPHLDPDRDLILNGGPCRAGLESTVIDLTGEAPALLRHGAVPIEALEPLVPGLRDAVRDPIAPGLDLPGLAAPGLLARHYAPRTPVILFDNLNPPAINRALSEHHALADAGRSPDEPVRLAILAATLEEPALLDFLETHRADFTHNRIPEFVAVATLSPTGDLTEAAARLFASLRTLDAADADVILAQTVPNEGLGRAINDRLQRASASL